MSEIKIAILGAGNVSCSPHVFASLATFFGERPLAIHLWDADEERLDTFDRLARTMFLATKATHRVLASTDVHEALEGVDRAIVQIGSNCARKYIRPESEMANEECVRLTLNDLAPRLQDECVVANLMPSYRHLPIAHARHFDWPKVLVGEDRNVMIFQTLRWINGEDGFYPLLRDNQNSPLKAWLNSSEIA